MRRISAFLWMILLSSFILHPSSFLCAQNHEHVLAAGVTMIPGTVYYAPDGRMNQDSAWWPISQNWTAPRFASLLIKCDSAAVGYTDATAMRIEIYFGSRTDTLHYIIPDTAGVVCNLTFHGDPADTNYYKPVPFYLAGKHRYRITVSDTLLLDTLKEILAQ